MREANPQYFSVRTFFCQKSILANIEKSQASQMRIRVPKDADHGLLSGSNYGLRNDSQDLSINEGRPIAAARIETRAGDA